MYMYSKDIDFSCFYHFRPDWIVEIVELLRQCGKILIVISSLILLKLSLKLLKMS